MAEFNIDDLRFPDTPDQTVTQGELLEIRVVFDNVGIASPVIFDLDKRAGKITLVDDLVSMHSVPIFLVKKELDERRREGNFEFKARINTKRLEIGLIKVIGTIYDLRGEPLFIRQLHEVI